MLSLAVVVELVVLTRSSADPLDVFSVLFVAVPLVPPVRCAASIGSAFDPDPSVFCTSPTAAPALANSSPELIGTWATSVPRTCPCPGAVDAMVVVRALACSASLRPSRCMVAVGTAAAANTAAGPTTSQLKERDSMMEAGSSESPSNLSSTGMAAMRESLPAMR